MSRLADRLAALDHPASRLTGLGQPPRLMPDVARPFWRQPGLLVIVVCMAATVLAMVAGMRYAASPPVPSRTTTRREVVSPEFRPATGPKAAELRDRALGVMAQGRPAEAAGLLEEAVAADPRDPQAWHALGVALVRRGEASRGLEALGRAVELAPDFADARRNLAIALDRGGRGAEAARHYRTFLEQASADAAGREDVRRRLGELQAAEAGR